MDISNYKYVDLIFSKIDSFPEDTKIIIPKWLKYGYKYTRGMMICGGCDSNLPEFEKIIDIFIIENQPFFVTEKWLTHEFSEQFHAYKLSSKNDKFNIVDVKLLMYKEPFNLHQPHSSVDCYLVPEYEYVF